MNLLLDIMDILALAWPPVACFALALFGGYVYSHIQKRRDRRAYAAYEARMRHEWKSIGYDAWLEVWEVQEQEQER